MPKTPTWQISNVPERTPEKVLQLPGIRPTVRSLKRVLLAPSLLKDAGLGVFADEDVSPGELITEYGGRVVDWKQAR